MKMILLELKMSMDEFPRTDRIDQMAEAVKKVEMISPAKCRDSVKKRFSVERMVNEYEDLFKKIVGIA